MVTWNKGHRSQEPLILGFLYGPGHSRPHLGHQVSPVCLQVLGWKTSKGPGTPTACERNLVSSVTSPRSVVGEALEERGVDTRGDAGPPTCIV